MIREFMKMHMTFMREHGKYTDDWKYSGVEDFVLRHGTDGKWSPLPFRWCRWNP